MFTASLGIFLLGLLAAAAGGFLGAGIGGNFAFVLTGFSVLFAWGVVMTDTTLWGVDPSAAFNYIAFGPFVGPHIAFAGGVAAAAYATKKGYLKDGKDVTSPLAGLGRPSVLMVGSAFGVLGYLIQIGYSKIPWFGGHTDSVALTVVTSGIIARLVFGTNPYGKGSLLNPENFRTGKKEKGAFLGKFDTDEKHAWVPYQETPAQFSAMGLFFGLAAAGAGLMLAINFPFMAGNASTFPFAISAVIILFLILGYDMPVQHHVTIVGALGAVLFFPVLQGQGDQGLAYYASIKEMASSDWMSAVGAILIGAGFGWLGAFWGEFFNRIWHARGTTHIDPPASAIWLTTTIAWGLATICGLAS